MRKFRDVIGMRLDRIEQQQEKQMSDIEDLKTAMDEMKTEVQAAVARITDLLSQIHQNAGDAETVRSLIQDAKDEAAALHDAAGTFSPSGN